MAESPLHLDNNFKDTQVGRIPADWELVKLGELITEAVSGDWGLASVDDEFNFVRARVIRGTDFSKVASGWTADVPERFIKPSSFERRGLKPGDLLIELSGGSKNQPTGRILFISAPLLARAKEPLIFTNFVKLLRVKSEVALPEYVARFWSDAYNLGKTTRYEKRTTGIRNFKYKEFIANEPIPLPPLPEQRKIATVLSIIEEAIEQQDNIIAAARELKKSLTRHLFTYGPVPLAEAEGVPLTETEIGPMPQHWEVVPLGEVVHPERGIKRGPWGGSIKKEIFVPYGYKVYEQKNVIANDFGVGSYFIDDNKFRELIDFEVQAGDILITAAGTIGRLAIVPENAHKGIINQALIRIRLNENAILKSYFKYAFTLLVHHRVLDGISHGATLKNLSSVKVLRNLPTFLPPLSEQREITTILSTIDGKIEVEQQWKAMLQELFKTMLHKLMTGQIRVKDIEV